MPLDAKELILAMLERGWQPSGSDPDTLVHPQDHTLSVRYHPATDTVTASPALERAIDATVYALFRLPEPCRIESERGFWGPRFAQEFPRLAQECQAPRVA